MNTNPDSSTPESQKVDDQKQRERQENSNDSSWSAIPKEVVSILRERADLLARQTEQTGPAVSTIDVLPFTLQQEWCALDARAVREVISQPEITPVPKTPEHLVGIVNLRGEVLPVMDIRFLLGIRSRSGTCDWMVVLGEDRVELGIVVDQVSAVMALAEDDVLPGSETSLPGGELVKGVTAEAVIVLDVDRLLADPRLTI